jgi:hypothetical protein
MPLYNPESGLRVLCDGRQVLEVVDQVFFHELKQSMADLFQNI